MTGVQKKGENKMKKNNKAKMITLLVGAGLLFGACGTTQAATTDKAATIVTASSAVSSAEAASSSSSQSNAQTFTLDELAQYDGKNGNDAYVAVSGTVYDVTNADRWQNGNHYGVQGGHRLHHRHQPFAAWQLRFGWAADCRNIDGITQKFCFSAAYRPEKERMTKAY